LLPKFDYNPKDFLDKNQEYKIEEINKVFDEISDKINAKYKAELDAVKQVKPATTPTAQPEISLTQEIENAIIANDTKTNIENKRQETLAKSIEEITDPNDPFFEVGTWNIYGGEFQGKTKQEVIDKINAKYDTELARELYKEMKAGKMITEFTPAEQEILGNPAIFTQELRDNVDAEPATTTSEITEYGDYSILKGEDGTYDVQYYKEGIIGEYLSTKEEAIAAADRHKSTLTQQPTEPITLTTADGIEFDIELDEDDYSVTTAEQIEKSVSLQDKVNTLIEEGKATKFCK
jgi:hypothetical protein